MIRVGPAGIGGVKEAPKVLEEYNKQGIKAAEIPFTYQVWISNSQAKEIGKIAKKFDVKLSIHAPYFINLNSEDNKKIEASKKRVLDSCERAHYLNAELVVFHPGYYGKSSKEETYKNIKKEILEMQEIVKKNKWEVKLAPETTGKVNVFGSLDEILKLSKETNCSYCIDFAHLKARNNGKISYKEIVKRLPKKFHVHFSGIEFTSKGERNHILTKESEIKELLKALNCRDVTIINESPNPLGDSLKTKKILESL